MYITTIRQKVAEKKTKMPNSREERIIAVMAGEHLPRKTPEEYGAQADRIAGNLIKRAGALDPSSKNDGDGAMIEIGSTNVYGPTGRGADTLTVKSKIISEDDVHNKKVQIARWRERNFKRNRSEEVRATPGPLTGELTISEYSESHRYPLENSFKGNNNFSGMSPKLTPKLRQGYSDAGDLPGAVSTSASRLSFVRSEVAKAEQRQRGAKE